MDKVIYDISSVKERLVDYSENEREIELQSERLDRLNTKLIGVGAQVLTDMPKSPSPANDRVSDLLSMKFELEDDIKELIDHQRNERRELEKVIRKLRKANERSVIRYRYFDCMSWTEVTDAMYGAREDYLGKEDSYLRNVHVIHGKALEGMAKTLGLVIEAF